MGYYLTKLLVWKHFFSSRKREEETGVNLFHRHSQCQSYNIRESHSLSSSHFSPSFFHSDWDFENGQGKGNEKGLQLCKNASSLEKENCYGRDGKRKVEGTKKSEKNRVDGWTWKNCQVKVPRDKKCQITVENLLSTFFSLPSALFSFLFEFLVSGQTFDFQFEANNSSWCSFGVAYSPSFLSASRLVQNLSTSEPKKENPNLKFFKLFK